MHPQTICAHHWHSWSRCSEEAHTWLSLPFQCPGTVIHPQPKCLTWLILFHIFRLGGYNKRRCCQMSSFLQHVAARHRPVWIAVHIGLLTMVILTFCYSPMNDVLWLNAVLESFVQVGHACSSLAAYCGSHMLALLRDVPWSTDLWAVPSHPTNATRRNHFSKK